MTGKNTSSKKVVVVKTKKTNNKEKVTKPPSEAKKTTDKKVVVKSKKVNKEKPKPVRRQSDDIEDFVKRRYSAEFLSSLKSKGLYDIFVIEVKDDLIEKENMKQRKPRRTRVVQKNRTNYHVTITYSYYIQFTNRSQPYRKGPEETSITKIVKTNKLTLDDIESIVQEELNLASTEYSYQILKDIISDSYVTEAEMKKNANYDLVKESMYKAKINFDWVPDEKFVEDGQCVYNALCSLKNVPKKFGDRFKLLSFFQECENTVALIENRSERYLTFDSGIKPIWLQNYVKI
jgi:hypothetical protein